MSYPKITDKDFYKKITKKYNRFTIPKKRKTFRQICYPTEYKLQPSQKFLAKYINPKTPYKGILVFHGIGSGKTTTAINIAEQWKHKRKIVVVTPASLIGNFRDELRSPGAKNAYLTNRDRNKLKKLHPSSEEYKAIIKKSDKIINKYYKIYSYNKFVEKAQNGDMSLRNTLLIVDEIQNMVSEDGTYYETLYDAIHDAPSSLRVVLLSATPLINKPIDLALTFNLLRIPLEFPTKKEFERTFIKYYKKRGKVHAEAKNLDMFQSMIKGYVSYFRGADIKAFPAATVKYVKCEMSNFQYRSYITVLKQEEKRSGVDIKRRHKIFKKGQLKKLSMSFYSGVRAISNIAFPNKYIGERGYRSLQGTNLKLKNIKKYSIKFYKIIRKIMRGTGTMFVYSNFKEYGGLKSFAKLLESVGYSNYFEYGSGYKRYGLWTGDIKSNLREEMKAVFNNPDNVNGSKIKVILLSLAGKEGLSLKNVRQIHILEPFWHRAGIEQIIGRGIRYCSHFVLPSEKRNVKVYIYMATHYMLKESVDQYIKSLADRKNALGESFNQAMKEIAIDCHLFYHGNVYPKDRREGRDIVCKV